MSKQVSLSSLVSSLGARPNNEVKIKEWISIEKADTAFKPNDEDSVPTFPFNNVAFEQKFTGSQLDLC